MCFENTCAVTGEVSGNKDCSAFDGALIVLLLTAASYLVAFGFDVGYLSYFGLPMILAEVSLRGLLFCAGAGIGLGFLLIVADTLVTSLPLNIAPIVWRKLAVFVLKITSCGP